MKNAENIGKVQEFDEAIRAAGGWYYSYQGKSTDTGLIVCSTKFGDSIHVRGLANNRETTVTFKYLACNAKTDTNFIRVPTCSYIWPLPVLWKFWVDETDNSLDSVNVFVQHCKR